MNQACSLGLVYGFRNVFVIFLYAKIAIFFILCKFFQSYVYLAFFI